MSRWTQILGVCALSTLTASCAFLESPSTTATQNAAARGAQTTTFASVAVPGTTWIAYEVKSSGVSLIPSYCAAAPGVPFRGPIAGSNDGVCVFSDKQSDGLLGSKTLPELQRGFNPPGAAGRSSEGASVRVNAPSVDGKIFQFFQVFPGRYFPALLGIGNQLTLIDGRVPYFEVQQGKINYLGSFNVDIGAEADWEPQSLADAILAQDPSFDVSRLNATNPRKARITCEKKTGILNIGSANCFFNVLEGPFF